MIGQAGRTEKDDNIGAPVRTDETQFIKHGTAQDAPLNARLRIANGAVEVMRTADARTGDYALQCVPHGGGASRVRSSNQRAAPKSFEAVSSAAIFCGGY